MSTMTPSKALRDLAVELRELSDIPAATKPQMPPVHLTPREKETLTLLSEDCTNKTIARRLDISVGTVRTYIAHLRDKLHVDGVAGLTRAAIEMRLTE